MREITLNVCSTVPVTYNGKVIGKAMVRDGRLITYIEDDEFKSTIKSGKVTIDIKGGGGDAQV